MEHMERECQSKKIINSLRQIQILYKQQAEAILTGFNIQDQAFLEIISGTTEPSGLLPLQMPADMKTVEEQYEDRPFDMECHVDSEGNKYDFGFGLNWSGFIFSNEFINNL